MTISASVVAVLLLLNVCGRIWTNAQQEDRDVPPPKSNTDSSEDRSFGYNSIYTPSTVNFNEIFTNSLSMLNDEPGLTTVNKEKDEEFHLSSLPSQFVEFHPHTTTLRTTTTPRPRFLTASYLKRESTTHNDDSTMKTSTTLSTTVSTSTTTAPATQAEVETVRVLPIKNYQRGVLDLIFPATRVRNFKSVFNTVRRMLSSTFRK